MGTQTGRAYTKSGDVEKYETSVGVSKKSGSGTVSVTNNTTGDYKVELSNYSTGTASNYDVTTVTNYGDKTKTFYWKKDTITVKFVVSSIWNTKHVDYVYIDFEVSMLNASADFDKFYNSSGSEVPIIIYFSYLSNGKSANGTVSLDSKNNYSKSVSTTITSTTSLTSLTGQIDRINPTKAYSKDAGMEYEIYALTTHIVGLTT